MELSSLFLFSFDTVLVFIYSNKYVLVGVGIRVSSYVVPR